MTDAESLNSLTTVARRHDLCLFPCSSLDHPLAVYLYHFPAKIKIITHFRGAILNATNLRRPTFVPGGLFAAIPTARSGRYFWRYSSNNVRSGWSRTVVVSPWKISLVSTRFPRLPGRGPVATIRTSSTLRSITRVPVRKQYKVNLQPENVIQVLTLAVL